MSLVLNFRVGLSRPERPAGTSSPERRPAESELPPGREATPAAEFGSVGLDFCPRSRSLRRSTPSAFRRAEIACCDTPKRFATWDRLKPCSSSDIISSVLNFRVRFPREDAPAWSKTIAFPPEEAGFPLGHRSAPGSWVFSTARGPAAALLGLRPFPQCLRHSTPSAFNRFATASEVTPNRRATSARVRPWSNNATISSVSNARVRPFFPPSETMTSSFDHRREATPPTPDILRARTAPCFPIGIRRNPYAVPGTISAPGNPPREPAIGALPSPATKVIRRSETRPSAGPAAARSIPRQSLADQSREALRSDITRPDKTVIARGQPPTPDPPPSVPGRRNSQPRPLHRPDPVAPLSPNFR